MNIWEVEFKNQKSSSRSDFWFCITEDDNGNYNFYASRHIIDCLNFHFPQLQAQSYKGWSGDNTQKLWIPCWKRDDATLKLEEIYKWADFAGNLCLWLPNKFTSTLFVKYNISDCLRYCIARDFNFWPPYVKDARTEAGEAEYRLKYKLETLSKDECKKYQNVLNEATYEMASLLPLYYNFEPVVVTTIPVGSDNKFSLAQELAKALQQRVNLNLCLPSLRISKHASKGLSVEDKLKAWHDIYSSNSNIDIDYSMIPNSNFIIVDDLYQSGITIRMYADFLKKHGAKNVYGISCVKSLRDDDNTRAKEM